MNDHNNDNKDGEHKGMMWMMLVCCLVPVLILFGGTTFFKSIGYGWVGLVLVAGFVIFHIRHMFGSHGSKKSKDSLVKDDNDSSNHKSCCH